MQCIQATLIERQPKALFPDYLAQKLLDWMIKIWNSSLSILDSRRVRRKEPRSASRKTFEEAVFETIVLIATSLSDDGAV